MSEQLYEIGGSGTLGASPGSGSKPTGTHPKCCSLGALASLTEKSVTDSASARIRSSTSSNAAALKAGAPHDTQEQSRMNNITRLPPFGKTLHVEADIPVSQLDEYERMITALIAIRRPSGAAPWRHSSGSRPRSRRTPVRDRRVAWCAFWPACITGPTIRSTSRSCEVWILNLPTRVSTT